MSHYNRHRRDNNHKSIIEGLRAVGATVKDTSQLSGFVDCIVIYRQRVTLLEIKNDKAQEIHKRLTEAESEFHSSPWGEVAVIVETLQEAYKACGITVSL